MLARQLRNAARSAPRARGAGEAVRDAVRLEAVNRGGEAFHERPGRPVDDLGVDGPQSPVGSPGDDEQGTDGTAVMDERAREGAATGSAGSLEALDLRGAARLQDLLEQQATLGQRLARGQPGLGHRDRVVGVIRVAQEERGVVDLEHVGDSAQLDGGEVLEARSGAEAPLHVALRRASARPADVTQRGHVTPSVRLIRGQGMHRNGVVHVRPWTEDRWCCVRRCESRRERHPVRGLSTARRAYGVPWP